MRWHETDTERASEAVRSVWELNTMMFWVHREKICQRCWLRRYLTNFGSFYTRTGQWLLFRSRSILKKKKEKKKKKIPGGLQSELSEVCQQTLNLSSSDCNCACCASCRDREDVGLLTWCPEMPVIFKIKADLFWFFFFFFLGCAWHHLFSSSSFAPSSSP